MQARAQPAPQPAEAGMPPMPSFVRIPHEQPPERGQAGGHSDRGRQDTARRSAGPPPAPKAAPSHEKRSASPPAPPAQSPTRPRQTGLDLMQMLNFKNIDLDSDPHPDSADYPAAFRGGKRLPVNAGAALPVTVKISANKIYLKSNAQEKLPGVLFMLYPYFLYRTTALSQRDSFFPSTGQRNSSMVKSFSFSWYFSSSRGPQELEPTPLWR